VFSNLMGNALLRGDPAAPVTVRAQVAGRDVSIEVHNDGPAIPAELQATIFNPFRRGERDSRSSTAAVSLCDPATRKERPSRSRC